MTKQVLLLGFVTSLGALAQTTGAPASAVPSATLVPARDSPDLIGVQPQVIVSGDFNGDGLPDLVIANGVLSFTLTILLATGNGAFIPAPGSPISVGEIRTVDLALGDFNGDGIIDIACLGQTNLYVFLGDGHGGFSPAPASPINTNALGIVDAGFVSTGDFNGDHKLDLVVLDRDTTGDVLVLLGDGTGNFTPAPGIPEQTGQSAEGIAVADFNMDGHLDIATITGAPANEVLVLLGDGTGEFASDPKGPIPAGQYPTGIVSGDFNGDGKVDLAVRSGTLMILLGDGAGGFVPTPETSVDAGLGLGLIAVGDVDGDGVLDLVLPVLSQPSGLVILLGDGTGGFAPAASGIINSPGGAYAVTLADFNGDGRLDVGIADYGSGNVSVLLGASTAASSLALSASGSATVGVPFSFTIDANTSGFRAPTGAITVRDGATVVLTEGWTNGATILQTMFNTAGAHTLEALYLGDVRTTGSASQPLTMDVARGSQTISFPTLPSHAFGDAPFTVVASSSSGLPVTITVVSGPAIIAGNLLTITGAGIVTLQASQPGDQNYLPAPSVEQQLQVASSSFRIGGVVNAASYSAGPFAPSSYAVVFGVDLASLASSGNLPTTLGGARIQITDASGKLANALLYFASPAQINFLLPSGLSTGTETMTVQTQAGLSAMVPISIAAVSPGIFSADATGTGVAAGSALLVSADGTQTQLPISNCSGAPVVCTAVPIHLGSATDTVYLSLYGTGIRGRSSLSNVTATMGGVGSEVLYAGAQPDFPGLDQVNLQINPALRGQGVVQIALIVDGVAANVVTVAIQ